MTNTTPEAPSESVAEPTEARGEKLFDWIFRALQRVLIDGPDPVAADDPHSLLEVLLPWPVRLACVGAVAFAASLWRETGVGQQVSWGLQVGAFCLTSIIAAFWLLILGVDCLLAAAWFVPFEARDDAPRRWEFLHSITFINRQIEHFKALLIWTLVAFAASGVLAWQLGVTAAAFLLAPPLINGLARLPLGFLGSEPGDKRSGGLLWRRRILIYLATFVGLASLALRAPGQLLQLAPLIAAFGGGLALRVVRHELRARRVKREQNDEAHAKLTARKDFRKEQAQAAEKSDAIAPLFVVACMAAVIVFSWWQRNQLAQELSQPNDGSPAPLNACTRDAEPPVTADIALFLMADTQTHELSGLPFPGQTELATVFARTATRPVALDMMSSVPIAHFRRAYAGLVAERKLKNLSAPYWGHLGDMADIGCSNELTRMLALLTPFKALGPLASLAVGNHETSFEGSFHWSPYWDSACKSGRMSPDEAVTAIASFLPASTEKISIPAAYFNPSGAVLASVVRLGISKHRDQARGVFGVFLDTSDGRAFDTGNPGSVGSVSADQITKVEAALSRLRQQSADEYKAHPAYVLFAHVPLDALHQASRERVTDLVTRLNANAGSSAEPSVLGLLTAHTHVASSRRHCVDHKYLREVVLGSTVDPPQQAAIVELGPDQRGTLSLSVRTLAAVARPGLTCGADAGAVRAKACRSVAAQLPQIPACRALLAPDSHAAPPRDCQDLEHNSTFTTRLSAIRTYQGPRDAAQRRALDELNAKALLECICHDDETCKPTATPLADESYLAILSRKLEDPARQTELSCLAWAAGAMQAHKDADMTLSEAMRCSFDDPTIVAERVSIAKLEATTCY